MKRLLTGVSFAAMLMTGTAQAETTLQLVEVITSPQRTEVLEGMIAKFEEANPDVTVEVTSLPWGQAFEKLATMVQGGQIPDVVEMPDRWLSLYANNDQLVDLGSYMESLAGRIGELNDRATFSMAATSTTPCTWCPMASICAPCSGTRSCSQKPVSTARPKPWMTSWLRRKRSPRSTARPAIACAVVLVAPMVMS